MRFLRFQLLLQSLALATVLLAGQASASTISVTLVGDNSTCNNGGSCSSNAGLTGTDRGVGWNTAGSTSVDQPWLGSTAATFGIDAVAAIDGGGDGTATGFLNFDIQIDIVTTYVDSEWNLDLSQNVLGLYGLRGDGTASAVGNQSDGSASIGPFTTTVAGAGNFNFGASNSSFSADASNNGNAAQQFTGGRNDLAILTGTGSQSILVNIDFDISAMTNDGCSGFICSSISGGEEAATLFGSQGVMDQAVDDYSTWGRSVSPDGYNSNWQLNITSVPEPSTALLVGVGLAGIAARRRRSA